MKQKTQDLAQFAKDDDLRAQILTLQSQLHKASMARAERDVAVKALAALQDRVAVLEGAVVGSNHVVPAWTTKHREKGQLHRATLVLLASDQHFDEVVRPEEVDGVNKYNRVIALQRLHRVQERVEMLAKTYFSGLAYDGVVVLWGGDTLSGAIHEELVETNEDTVNASLLFWSDHLSGFVNGLRKTFGKVHCAGVPGNHGRRTRKPVAKRRAKDNLDWLLYHMVARATPDVTWQIPESSDCDVKIYDETYRLTHGDAFHGGSGISGMLAPIMLGQHRVAQQQMAMSKAPFSWMVLGHWHQFFHGRGVIVNGCLKGYDEYAYVSKLRYEPPIQAFWAATPEHGAAFSAPIFCEDRKKEGW